MKMHIEWLKAARDDLILIQNIYNNPQITHLTAFHAQQVVEKSIKAYLEKRGDVVPKTHKIQTLVDLAGLDFSSQDDIIQLLDSLYIESRYPGDMGLLPYGKPTLEDAREFYEFASSVFDMICNLLEVGKEELV